MPHSSMAKRSTGEGYKEIAKWLNSTTGGSNFRSGFIDLPPETMKYIVGYFGGGALRFAMDKGPNIALKAAGADIEDSKVAFLSRISGRVMPYQDQSTFYDRRDELMQIKDEAKAVRGVERKEFMSDHGYKLHLLPLLKSTEQQLKALRKRRNAVYGLDMPAKQKDLRLKSIERQMKIVIDRFNLRYTQLKEK